MADELEQLSPVETRILGSLAEKKLLTPDVYPMSVNAVLVAANQKTAREPVMALELPEIHRVLATLQQKGLVRHVAGSRVDRFEHLLAQRFSLTQSQVALLALMMVRGPQTAHELLARADRMASFPSVSEVRGNLDLLIGRRPALVVMIERGPGQREERYAHLFGGPVAAPASPALQRGQSRDFDLEARIEALEEKVARLAEQLRALTGET
jgi:uncharacterized protein YceH (UPF0502 family)